MFRHPEIHSGNTRSAVGCPTTNARPFLGKLIGKMEALKCCMIEKFTPFFKTLV